MTTHYFGVFTIVSPGILVVCDILHASLNRSQQGLPELEMPECQDYQVVCQNEGMETCHNAVNGCGICYCADHEYQSEWKSFMQWIGQKYENCNL